MPLNTAPSVSDRISEEFEGMRRLRDHYGPGLCSKGSDTVFETNQAMWSTLVRSMLGVKSYYRLGTTEPRVYGTATDRANPITPSSNRPKDGIPFFSKPLVVAQRRGEELEVGIGVSIREVRFGLVLPERLGQRPYYDYDRLGANRVGVVALTVTTTEDQDSALVRRRTIAGEGFDLFDEEAGGRIVKEGQYQDGGERLEAVLKAFHDGYWGSVSEPA